MEQKGAFLFSMASMVLGSVASLLRGGSKLRCWGCPQLHLEWCQLLTGKSSSASTDPHTHNTHYNETSFGSAFVGYGMVIQLLYKLYKGSANWKFVCPQVYFATIAAVSDRGGPANSAGIVSDSGLEIFFSSKESSAVHSVDKLALFYCCIYTLIYTLMYNHTYCIFYDYIYIVILIFHLPII